MQGSLLPPFPSPHTLRRCRQETPPPQIHTCLDAGWPLTNARMTYRDDH